MAGFSHLFSSKGKNDPLKQRAPVSDVLSSTAYNHKSDNVSKLMHFLESPLWITKTDDFIQSESIVFEESVDDCHAYHQVYENFKVMVDKLLVDLRLSCGNMPAEVLAQTIEQSKIQAQTNRVVKELMHPLFLYDNYVAFKQAMIEQNIQLQMLALDDIQKRTGNLPLDMKEEQLLDKDGLILAHGQKRPPVSEDQLLEMALKMSKEEYDELQRQVREEEEAIEQALRESERLFELLKNQARISVHDLRALLEQIPEAPEQPDSATTPRPPSALPVMPSEPTPVIASHPSNSLVGLDQFVSVKNFISPEELQRRQAYLRAQRDKLQSKKEALRVEAEINVTSVRSSSHQEPKISESRKKLAEKLKEEVKHHQ
ncbi:hypothetical protein RvY_02533 [Ramazzottius varieornatus]|uniref:Cilia- and flagella-associated protein 36 n=1 Tax=Ramazzottius varieornatus TaxID=947166 RepID=A0A1D1UK31_RAMVA|nr:hypothetical protein RvY_02533 [Ramazzottius varieornatus]